MLRDAGSAHCLPKIAGSHEGQDRFAACLIFEISPEEETFDDYCQRDNRAHHQRHHNDAAFRQQSKQIPTGLYEHCHHVIHTFPFMAST